MDNNPINLHVFLTEKVERATRIKLMSFSAGGRLPDWSHIHSTFGITRLALGTFPFSAARLDRAFSRW
jgi:hypothetical protein